MLQRAGSYEALYDGFRWNLPERLNMAAQVCDYWAETAPDRVAIIDLSDGRQEVSYGRLREMADGLAQALVARGVGRGDRVGVLRSQGAWCAAAHVAIWKIGAISIPLFKLFKQEALTSRVSDAGAGVVVKGVAPWLAESGLGFTDDGEVILAVTDQVVKPASNELVYHP